MTPTKAQAQEVGAEVRPECPQCGRRMIRHQTIRTSKGGNMSQVYICQGCNKTLTIKIEKGG